MITQPANLVSFVEELKQAHIHHRISHHLDNAVTVEVAVPGTRWEVDFYGDGRVEVELFRSDGTIFDASILHDLIEEHGS